MDIPALALHAEVSKLPWLDVRICQPPSARRPWVAPGIPAGRGCSLTRCAQWVQMGGRGVMPSFAGATEGIFLSDSERKMVEVAGVESRLDVSVIWSLTRRRVKNG